MTIDPRKDFRESPHGKTWNDVVDSEQFQAAAKAAWVHFTMSLPTPTANEIEGAREFLRCFMSLADEPPKPTQSTISPQLLRT